MVRRALSAQKRIEGSLQISSCLPGVVAGVVRVPEDTPALHPRGDDPEVMGKAMVMPVIIDGNRTCDTV
ncbi:MAG TPA: hypothetical protein VF463_14695 [Sphingobium sp.]